MSAENIAKLKQQILAQGTTSQWSGEGHGSADANAEDIAKILDSTGITDIKQFGQVPKIGSVPVTPQYSYTDTGMADDSGTIYATKLIGYVDPEGKPVDPSKVVQSDEGDLIAQNVVTGTTFGNKVTGATVPNTYSERQVGNFFGGTFAGKGNTGYGVQFDAQGNPIFYTQGASSKDTSLMPLVQMALMASGAGGLLGNAILGAGASQVAAGALGNAIIGGVTTDLAGGDWKKGALVGGAGGALGGYLQGLDGSLVPSLDAADTAGGLIPKYGTSYDDWMQLVMDNPEAQQALLNSINGTQVASTTPITPSTTADGLFNVPSADTVNITGAKVPTQLSPDIFSAVTSQLSNNLTPTTPNVEVTAQNPNKTGVPAVLPITSNLTTTNVVPNVEVTGEADKNKSTTPAVIPPAGTTTTTSGTGTSKDLTTDQKVNLAKAGLALVGLLGGGAAAGGLLGGSGGGSYGGVGAIPTQGIPLNSDDYFNAIQRNYNALLPAVPRDVASPLRDWYNSSYGGGTTPTTQVNITPQPMPAVQSAPAAQPMPAVMSHPIASAGGLMSSPISPVADIMPTKPVAVEPAIQTSPSNTTAAAPVTLSPAQKAYADFLKTQPGSGSSSDIDSYVKGLSDYQALKSLDSYSANRLNVPNTLSGYDTASLLAQKYNTSGPITFGDGVSVNYGTGLISGRAATDSSITGGSIGAGNTDPTLLLGLDPNIVNYLQNLPKPYNA